VFDKKLSLNRVKGTVALIDEIEIGHHFTGDFDRLTFIVDDDAEVGGDSSFRNIEFDNMLFSNKSRSWK